MAADVAGPYETWAGSRDASLVNAGHLSINDLMLLVPAIAAVTEHLGFGLTSSVMQYPPITSSRLFSTLDHPSKARVAWNNVISFTTSAVRNDGRKDLPGSDGRYEMVDEFRDQARGMRVPDRRQSAGRR